MKYEELEEVINRQKAEIERLTDKLGKVLSNVNVKDELHFARLQEENAELQKQVYELKQENSVLSVTVELQDEAIEQAVKDTAKEIFKEIFESCVFSFKGNDDYKKGFCDALEQYDKQLRDLAKQKGVEVE